MAGTGTSRIKLIRDIHLTSPPWGLPGGKTLTEGMEFTVGNDTAKAMEEAGEAKILGEGESKQTIVMRDLQAQHPDLQTTDLEGDAVEVQGDGSRRLVGKKK